MTDMLMLNKKSRIRDVS